MAASRKSGLPLFLGSYPITPACDLLHELAQFKNFGVTTFQAEDEIAAVCAAIGASFGGALAITSTSGPGMALKSEAMGLAVMVELPLVVVDVQRGGPSTGLPTKTEQADLLQALFGRNGESPIPVLAAATPGDCFARRSRRCRSPLALHDARWCCSRTATSPTARSPGGFPRVDDLPDYRGQLPRPNPEELRALPRDPETLARPWAIPGTPGLEHRIGGLEKQDVTGNVSYDPQNHERMVELRAEKVARVAHEIPRSRGVRRAGGRTLAGARLGHRPTARSPAP